MNHTLLVGTIMTQWETLSFKPVRQPRRHTNSTPAIYQHYPAHHERAAASYQGEISCMKV